MSLRRFLPLFAATAVLAATPAAVSAQLKHGDVNGDGVVTALDAQAILTAAVSLPLPAGYVVANGDANCDATTGALDAQIVLSFVIGLDVSQHCVGQAFGAGAITIALTPTDTSVLVNRSLRFRAILKDTSGFTVQRPIQWTSSNNDLVAVDSARGDTAWVSNKGLAFDAVATLTATADGVSQSTTVRVFRSYAGIVIQPQRGDTIFQLNGSKNFNVRMRDSLGAFTTFPSAQWSTANPAIATVAAGPSNSVSVIGKSTGMTWLRATNQSNPTDVDSVPVHVVLPPVNSCSGQGGTLHTSVTYTTSQTWSASTNPHYVSGAVQFDSLANLTIEPGALVCMSPSAWLYFQPGAELHAIGTAAEPIRFQSLTPASPWYTIRLGDNTSVPAAPPMDTSRLRHVIIEGGNAWEGSLQSWERHVVFVDSTTFRRSGYTAVQLTSKWSRMSHSVIDTVGVHNAGYAVRLDRGHLDSTTIRVGLQASAAIAFNDDSATVRDVTIDGGQRGIYMTSGSVDSVRVNDVTIAGTSGYALDLANSALHSGSSNVTITSGARNFRGELENFARLFPDSAAQETLFGADNDTIEIVGGLLQRDTVVARVDLPWYVSGSVLIDVDARLEARAGALFSFGSGNFRFTNGGTLHAIGTSAAPVRFARRPSASFQGLLFENAGGTVRDTSILRHVEVWGASGVCGSHTCSAISSYDRHVLLIDSTVVSASGNGGIGLIAAGSRITQSRVDSTGSPTSGYAGLYMGGGTFADSVRVYRSGADGIIVGGSASTDTVRLRNIMVAHSLGIGLYAEGARIVGDSGTVTLLANSYPYRGYLDSFAALAKDSVAQQQFLGNTTDVAVIVGSSSRPFRGRVAANQRDTIVATKHLRWQVESQAYIDTLATFLPSAGARVTFWSGGLIFQRSGRLVAMGTATDTIRFEKASPAAGAFFGLRFDNAGAAGGALPPPPPVDTSVLRYVLLNEASGQCGDLGCATLATHNRHMVLMDSSYLRMASSGGVHLAARGSRLAATRIDTTLSGSYAAVSLAGGTALDSVTVLRSGQAGFYLHGGVNTLADTVRVRKLTIQNSQSVGLWAENGRLVGDSGSVVLTGNAYPFRGYIDNLAAIAKDSLSQVNFLGNVADRVEIVGRSDRTFRGKLATLQRDTLRAIPQIDWLIESHAYIDSLGVFKPSPGSRIGFWSAGMTFRQGGQLYAHGLAGDTIEFAKYSPSSGTFNGMEFADAGGASLDSSVIINARFVNSNCQSGPLGCAVLVNNPGHMLLLDSVHVQNATNGGIHLSAPGSRILRSLIDTSGTASHPSLALSGGTRAANTTVRYSRSTGLAVGGSVTAAADTIRLSNIQLLNGAGVALHAEGGRIVGDSGSVYATGNSYAYRGFIDNFAAIAKDSVAQMNLVGNVDSRVEIIGNGSRPFRGRVASNTPDTIRAIKQLPWLIANNVEIDTLARFIPGPGARIGFWSAALRFVRGGRLISRGTSTDSIVFEKWGPTSGNFNGIYFGNRGGTGVDTSWVVNTIIRDGQSCQNGTLGCAVLAPEDRHVLLVDSSSVRSVSHGGVHLAATGSWIKRSVVDTTGNTSTSDAYLPLSLAPGTLAESTTVRNSRRWGVRVVGAVADTTEPRAVRLRQLSILDNADAGLWADGARIIADSVTISGNAYPYYGYLDNFVALGPDSATQTSLLGNTDNVAQIVGHTGRGLRGDPAEHVEVPLTAVAIPQLRWQVVGTTYFDSLTRFEPRPGANITFANSAALHFRKGAYMLAFGTATDSIYFRPIAGHGFGGILFDNPGAAGGAFPPPPPTASSWLKFVNIDSTSGVSVGSFGSAGLNAANRHQLTVEDSRFRRNRNGAIALQAPGSSLTRVRVDTTGSPTTSIAAIQLEDSVSLEDVEVFRSGQTGIYMIGKGITFENVAVRASLNVGLHIENGSQGLVLSSFTVDSSASAGVYISTSDIQLTACSVTRNGTNASHHGVMTASSYQNISVFTCNLVNNAGMGVFNSNTTNSLYLINASNNWWGDALGPTGPNGDGVGANVDPDGYCSAPGCPIFQGATATQQVPTPASPPRDVSTRALLGSRRRARPR